MLPRSLPPLAYYQDGSEFSRFIERREPTLREYVILLLALAPHVRPGFLDAAFKLSLPESGNFPEIGGTRSASGRGFMPTAETALFILAGDDLESRFEVQELLTGDHWFDRDGILSVEEPKPGEPTWSGQLLLDSEYIERFTLGRVSSPKFSSEFPAREIRTELEWDDLILSPDVRTQIEELRHWIDHNETLMDDWGMRARLKPGFRALFHGPPGTGKTLTATLLGKYTGRKVFRIDLSTVISKYVGETEKNLSRLFDRAARKDWILFFDEADALFGKRTGVKDAHDRYANQEVSYLLQRVEDFDGLVILASNFKANVDEAFLRRFNAIIQFPFPKQAEREQIWRKSFPDSAGFEEGVDLPAELASFELTGGNIINAVHHACIGALARGRQTITRDDALKGIRREMEKEGKVFKEVATGRPLPR